MTRDNFFTRLFLTRNVAAWDRALRALLLPLVIIGWLAGALDPKWAVVLGVLAAMLLVTSLTGTCSIYGLFGMSTRRQS